MNVARFHAVALSALFLAGCVAAPSASDPEEPAPAAAPAGEGVALRLEQAERSLDVGRDVPASTAVLQGVAGDPAATLDQRDAARLSLSQALEARGDHEGAISTIEALLEGHPEGPTTPAAEAAEARLRKLLTGRDATPRPRSEDTRPVPPFARALLRYFPTPSAGVGALEVRVLTFGGDAEASERLGTFAVDRAVREERRKACALCDDRLSLRAHTGRTGSWTGIPMNRAHLGSSLVVYYFDLGEGRIPARYDAELPLPTAEIAARLAGNEGLVAARERPGAPPVVLIAAPRGAQLAEVEEALSLMKALPTEPVSLPLKGGLKPDEIQGVVRGSFGRYRECYEAVLKHAAAAAGTARMQFGIRGDGSVEAVSVQSTDGLEHEAEFQSCVVGATSALVFPANHAVEVTTVTYPIVFNPNN